MVDSLEETLVGKFVVFAEESGKGYLVKHFPSKRFPADFVVLLKLMDNVSGGERTIFHHSANFKDGKIVRDETLFVGLLKEDRNLYTEFLKYFGNSEIKLTNSFEQLWASNSEKYLL